MSEHKEFRRPEMLFVFPLFGKADFAAFTITYHLGASYIVAYLKEKGIYASQLIHTEPIDLYSLTERILEQNPKIVGFTCYDSNYYLVKLLSQLLKNKNPALTIMVGGPTATFSSALIMQDNPAFDVCVRGEGEYTVLELIARLRRIHRISDIKGISYRVNGQLRHSPDRGLITGNQAGRELDILPSPYLNNIIPAYENAGILTSRGCIFQCTYCNFSLMSRWTVRYHSVERVISELKIIYEGLQSKKGKKGNMLVSIYDDTFSLNIEFAKNICRRLIEEKIQLILGAHTRVDRVDKELLELMHKAGFNQVNFGLESAIPKVIRNIKKVSTSSVTDSNLAPEIKFIKKARDYVKLAKEIGLDATVSVILGLPGATIEDDRQTLRFVRRLGVNVYYHNILQIFAGTELSKNYKRYGLGLRQSLRKLPYITEFNHNVYKIPEMEHSWHDMLRRKIIERIQRLITGNYGSLAGDGYPDVLLKDGFVIDNKTAKWLRHNLAIAPVVVFLYSHLRDNRIRSNIKKMFSSGIPIMDVALLIPLMNSRRDPFKFYSASARFKLVSGETFRQLGYFEYVSFSKFYQSKPVLKDREKKGEKNLFFTLFTHKDIDNFIRFCSQPDDIVLRGNLVRHNCYFLNECRWSDNKCPAVSFRRAMIDNDGSILTCIHGKPIAKVGDDRKYILKALHNLWEAIFR